MKKLNIVILFLALGMGAAAQTTNYQVHSLFVVNIAKYSTWPVSQGEFSIVVFGKSKVFDELNKHIAGKQINGLTVKVTQSDDVSSLAHAQLIFLADGKSGDLSDVLKSIEGKPVMVIAEREGLYKKGASFSFVIMENNTLRFDVNHAELEKRNIKVSKNLMNLANVVI